MAKIHPLTPCNELSRKQADCLRNSIIDELEKASEKGGTTIRSYANAFLEEGSFQFFCKSMERLAKSVDDAVLRLKNSRRTARYALLPEVSGDEK